MNIDDLTLREMKQIASLLPQVKEVTSGNECPYAPLINKNLFIRTVTFYYTGRLIKIYDDILLLKDVSWIADTGKFSESLKTGNFNEVEPFFQKETRIGRGGIMDVSEYGFELPLTQK